MVSWLLHPGRHLLFQFVFLSTDLFGAETFVN